MLELESQTQVASRPKLWAGAIIGTLTVAFFIFDGFTKLIRTGFSIEGSQQLGYPAEIVPTIGLIMLLCTALYIIPQTRILGAILLTGYLGGTVASHLRVGNGWFPIAFSFLFGALVWVAVVLRDPRLLSLILLNQWPESPQVAGGE